MPNQSYRDYFRDLSTSLSVQLPKKHPWYSFIVRNFSGPSTDIVATIEQEVYSFGDYFQIQARAMEEAITASNATYQECINLNKNIHTLEEEKERLEKILAKRPTTDNKKTEEKKHELNPSTPLNLVQLNLQIKALQSELKNKLNLLTNEIITAKPNLKDHATAITSVEEYLQSRVNYLATHDSPFPHHDIVQYVNPTTDCYKIRNRLMHSCREAIYKATDSLNDYLASRAMNEEALNHVAVANMEKEIASLNNQITDMQNNLLRLNQVPNPTFRSNSILNRGIAIIYPSNLTTMIGDALFRLPAEGMARGIDTLAGTNQTTTVQNIKVAVNVIPIGLSLITHTVAKTIAAAWNNTLGSFIDFCVKKFKSRNISSETNQVKKITPRSSPEVQEPPGEAVLQSPARSYLAVQQPEGPQAGHTRSSSVHIQNSLGIAQAIQLTSIPGRVGTVVASTQTQTAQAVTSPIIPLRITLPPTGPATHSALEEPANQAISERSRSSSASVAAEGAEKLVEAKGVAGKYLATVHHLDPNAPQSGRRSVSSLAAPHLSDSRRRSGLTLPPAQQPPVQQSQNTAPNLGKFGSEAMMEKLKQLANRKQSSNASARTSSRQRQDNNPDNDQPSARTPSKK